MWCLIAGRGRERNMRLGAITAALAVVCLESGPTTGCRACPPRGRIPSCTTWTLAAEDPARLELVRARSRELLWTGEAQDTEDAVSMAETELRDWQVRLSLEESGRFHLSESWQYVPSRPAECSGFKNMVVVARAGAPSHAIRLPGARLRTGTWTQTANTIRLCVQTDTRTDSASLHSTIVCRIHAQGVNLVGCGGIIDGLWLEKTKP